MARAVVLVKRVTKVETIDIDSCLEETHTLTNTVTDHPVEEGFNISDHVRPEPDVVTLRCFISNTPLSEDQVKTAVKQGEVDFETTAPEVIGSRADDNFAKLKKLRDEGTIISVVTTLKTYSKTGTEGMVISSVSFPRTRQNFDGLEFSLSLKQMRIVKNKSTKDTRPKEKNAGKKQKKGAQPKTEGPQLLRSKAKQIYLDSNSQGT